jgi:RNA polymerase sigma-70 factor (ECF subfamily)
LSQASDAELIRLVARGDASAMEALFRRHHETVHNLCFRLTMRRDAADDLVQETFLRVLRSAGSYRGEAAFTTWLYRVTRNICLDYLRTTHRRVATEGVGEERDPVVEEDQAVPDRRLILEEALSALSPEQREVLMLRRYHDLSFEELGRILGCSAGTARVRAHRALLALRQLCLTLERRRADV